ncbi:MAG TPA: hypothetical protein VIL74_17365 [Pyrinomonadaceae bacterium]|jgi:hypothetical protein
MIQNTVRISFILLFFLAFAAENFAQKAMICKPTALAALVPLPELKYDCDEDSDESEDAVLSQPNRRQALAFYARTLEKLTDAEWWRTPVEDLAVCDFLKKTGALTDEQRQDYEFSDYLYRLRGNGRFRVVVAKDPCYQTGFNGANVFLLNRVRGEVFAAEVIDGFYTRADFPLGFETASREQETIIEIATTSGGLYPSETYYYFTIDPTTKRAVPKKLFKEKGGFANQISSKAILGEPEEYGLPPRSEALRIIVNGRLARSFYVFEDTGEKFGDNSKFVRRVYKWNGRFYE